MHTLGIVSGGLSEGSERRADANLKHGIVV